MRASTRLPPYFGILLLAGCANHVSGGLVAGATIHTKSRFFVVAPPEEKRNVNQLLAAHLHKLGFPATTGPRDQMPPDTDVILTYRDQWMWDFRMFMLELEVTCMDARTDHKLGQGSALHGSLTRRSPEEMVAEVIGAILK